MNALFVLLVTLTFHLPTTQANGDTLHAVTGLRVVRYDRVPDFYRWPVAWAPPAPVTVYADTLGRAPGAAVVLTIASDPCAVATWQVFSRDAGGWSGPSNGAP